MIAGDSIGDLTADDGTDEASYPSETESEADHPGRQRELAIPDNGNERLAEDTDAGKPGKRNQVEQAAISKPNLGPTCSHKCVWLHCAACPSGWTAPRGHQD